MRPGSPTTSGEKRRMAEDAKEESVATDDDSDHTGADGSHSLNNAVKQWLHPLNSNTSLIIDIAASKGCVNVTL